MTVFDVRTATLPAEGEVGLVDIGSLTLENGAVVDDVTIAVQRWGELSPNRDNVVVVLHALTGDSHVTGPEGPGDETEGWWEGVAGPGAPIDTDRWCAIATNVLGGFRGSTGPSSPAPDGKPWGSRFPLVSVRDQVEADVAALAALGITEVAAVVGRGGGDLAPAAAASHIAGYMITNDVSSRDLGEGESTKFNAAALFQLMRAKGWDTFQPTGPWLVTLDEVGSYEDVRIQTWVNDELRQDVYAKEMIHNPYQIIEWLSATTTLQSGDIITTGTPAGVVAGMTPPQWLKAGDTIRIEMTGLGQMHTPVLDERDTRVGAVNGSDD